MNLTSNGRVGGVLNPFALVAHRDDREGIVMVVDIVDEDDKWFLYKDGDGTSVTRSKDWLVTRSMDRSRMVLVKDMLVEAWTKSSGTLGDAKLAVATDFAKMDANRIIDVPRTLDNVNEAFTEKRQSFWRLAIDTLRASPIDPVAGVQHAKEPA